MVQVAGVPGGENGEGRSWQVHREHVMTERMYQQEEEGVWNGEM